MDNSREEDTLSAIPYDQENAEKGEKRPNILLLMTDQQRHDTIKAGGADFMHTPHLDRLAASGRIYSHAFTPIPDGMPSRHNLLTGLTGKTHGYPENNRNFGMPGWIYTFPQLLSDHGYETISIGKNQFVPPRRHRGYDKIHLMESHPDFREEDDYALYLKEQGWGHILNIHGCENLLQYVPQSPLLPEQHQGDSWVADKAMDFLETNRGRHPWLMKVSWISPRPPQNPALRFAHLYKEKELPEPLKSTTPLSPGADENARQFRNIPAPWVRRYREQYYSSVSQVDYNIGRILDALEDTDQRRNTLIIFVSDHGDMLGDHGTIAKGLPYDSCTRIPFILSFPDVIDPGEKNTDFVDLNDVMPTILDAAGIQISYKATKLPGESLLVKKNKRKKDRNFQYVEYGSGIRRWISLRTKEYKYNYYYREGREELFDLSEDSAESRNLLYSSHNEEILAVRDQLKMILMEQERLRGPEGCLNEETFVALEDTGKQSPRSPSFPVFQNKIMDPREKSRMNNFMDEVLKCIEKEPLVELEQLDLERWQKEGGFQDKQIKDLLEKEKKLKAKHNPGE
ncbi:sulfatase-like hydrolase/transferase [Oceanispirochaeta sp.]|jgi:arylsulfatase|uniref:sulfatase family protein n=1 Tax=Oceanispirochaeta sp. TaxID=2035350 RepID=UPI00260E63E0|nr:sulfatase-like hydrolase/transferase [Oceanispirochaeta sp.]MDA3955257.1 sulfatase-like hydrolase/transferase [Oceanispirochaeta sp.]